MHLTSLFQFQHNFTSATHANRYSPCIYQQQTGCVWTTSFQQHCSTWVLIMQLTQPHSIFSKQRIVLHANNNTSWFLNNDEIIAKNSMTNINTPLLANSWAVAFPMPAVAPVITTVLPGILSVLTYFFPPVISLQQGTVCLNNIQYIPYCNIIEN